MDHPLISINPDILAGKPAIKGTRLAVEFIVGLLADGWSEADLLCNYPGLNHENILACLAYARDSVKKQQLLPSAA